MIGAILLIVLSATLPVTKTKEEAEQAEFGVKYDGILI